MKRILVPCDFSARSIEAFNFAMKIASRTNGQVTVLHVIYFPVIYDTTFAGGTPLALDPVYLSGIEEDVRNRFDAMKKEVKEHGVNTNLEIFHGEIVSAIKHSIDVTNADLVVMGTSGVSGFNELFIGSNTEKVVRHSPVPVFAVRKTLEIGSIKKILLPSLLNLDQTAFIHSVNELQDFFNATLHILLVNTPTHFRRDAEAHEALDEFAKHYKLKNYKTHFINYRNAESGIIDFAVTGGMDLIAMATHARKGLAHLFNGSITEDVVNHINSPVWTYALKHYNA